jgi:hypothetical protein
VKNGVQYLRAGGSNREEDPASASANTQTASERLAFATLAKRRGHD